MNDDERVDLTPLDPTRGELRFERAVRAITSEAAPLLAARRARQTRLGMIATWRRPLWVLAATVALLAGVFLVRKRTPNETRADAGTLADALGVPSAVSGYLWSGTVPSVEDLITTEVRP